MCASGYLWVNTAYTRPTDAWFVGKLYVSARLVFVDKLCVHQAEEELRVRNFRVDNGLGFARSLSTVVHTSGWSAVCYLATV